MQALRLLAPRRRMGEATTVAAATTALPEPAENDSSERPAVDPPEDAEYDDDDDDEDQGPFFDLDFSSASVRASSSSTSGSSDDSEYDDLTDHLDLVISLHRSRSASPSFHFSVPPRPLLKPAAASAAGLRTLSFAARRSSFARPSSASAGARSLRLFMESPLADAAAADHTAADEDPEPPRRAPPPSRDVIRRYLTKLSTRLRSVSVSVSVRHRRGRGEGGGGGFRRLRKSRSASAAVNTTTTTALVTARRDDSVAEKQDGIASAIAHCKESLTLHRRASLSDSPPLPRSRSDPGNYVQSS